MPVEFDVELNLIVIRFLCSSNHPLSSQSGFDQNLCFGDVLLSFTWSGYNQSSESAKKIKSPR